MSKRVLVLLHEDLVPPLDQKLKKQDIEFEPWETEYEVCRELENLGHKIHVLGAQYDLSKIREAIDEFKPHIVFNLLEEFHAHALFDQNIVSYLELLKIPYTGCNPRGLIIGRDKALSKKILTYHRIKVPKFFVFKKNQKIKILKNIPYPMIVKCLNEESSTGISGASIVNNDEKLKERIIFLHEKYQDDVIVEQFIEGREFFVGVYGNQKLTSLPIWELEFGESDNPEKEIYSTNAKFSKSYRKRKGIKTKKAKVNETLEKKIHKISKRTYKLLGLSGYARIDLRVTADEKIYIIEANPNPGISRHDEFASSAKDHGLKYAELLQKILSLGL